MAPVDPVQKARELIERRLGDIAEERGRLERSLRELGGVAKKDGRSGSRKRGGKAATPKAGRKRRRRRGGTRADQVHALVVKTPGIGAGEVAKSLKMKPNYIYRVVGDLEEDGKLKKKGRQLFAKN